MSRVQELVEQRRKAGIVQEEKHGAFTVIEYKHDELDEGGGVSMKCLCARVRCACGVELYDDWEVLKKMKDCGCGAGRRRPGRPRLTNEERAEREETLDTRRVVGKLSNRRRPRPLLDPMDLRRPVSLGLPVGLLMRIAARADKEEKSVSGWVVDALKTYLEYVEAQQEVEVATNETGNNNT